MKTNHAAQLANLDLNLIVVLQALFETKSTTRAADLIGRTQPAVSLSLRRLRDVFDDPLFVRSGQRLELTPLAKDLEKPVQEIMAGATRLFERRTRFDPASSTKDLKLAFPENALHLAHNLNQTITQYAPNMKVTITTLNLNDADYKKGVEHLISGEIDLLLSFYRSGAPRGLDVIRLPSQHWVTVHSHDKTKTEISLEEWVSYPHVIVTSGDTGRSPISDQLAADGLERQIGLRTTSFMQALYSVRESDMILNTMYPVIAPLVEMMGLTVAKTPIEIPDVSMSLLIRNKKLDPVSAWLAGLIDNHFLK